MTADLFAELCHRLGVQPDRRGFVDITCPHCSKEPKAGQTHCHMSYDGYYKCFICGEGGSLRKLRELIFGDAPREWQPVERKPPKPQPKRYDIMEHDADGLMMRYWRAPGAEAAWRVYAPLLDLGVLYELGLGTLPPYSSRCQHERLIVPLMSGGHCVGFRARAIDCECGKWLGPGGNPSRFLYNGQRLGPIPMGLVYPYTKDRRYIGDSSLAPGVTGRSVWIVENPVDAILLEQEGEAAVATLGVSVWDDDWTRLLLAAKPARAIVAYDNDAPGNGGGRAGLAAWQAEHPKAKPPLNGIKLANRLLEAGLPVQLWNWGNAPLKTDMGDLLRHKEAE